MAKHLLSGYSIISFTGADCEQFLQAQLTQNVLNMALDRVTLAGYCNSRGRLQATFILFRQGHGFLAIVDRSIVTALIKRLKMFILRSRCVIEDVSAQYAVFVDTESTVEPMKIVRHGQGNLSLALRTTPQSTNAPIGLTLETLETPTEQQSSANQPTEGDLALRLAFIQLGIPMITERTWEIFIPQEINFDLVSGVSFSKGCYPGQEVVARNHYLGKNKKRSAIAQCSNAVNIVEGTDVWQQGKDNEPVGQVVNVAHTDQATWLLFESPVDAIEEAAKTPLSIKVNEQSVNLEAIILPPYNIHDKGDQYLAEASA